MKRIHRRKVTFAEAGRRMGALAIVPLLASLPVLGLTGCFSIRTRQVSRTVVAPNLKTATLRELVGTMNAQFNAIKTLNASVDIAASTGGEHEGEVKEIPTFAGYMFLRQPGDMRVLLLLPVIRSRALDMVSDGKTFKLLIPPKNRAIEGSDVMMEAPETVPAGASVAELKSRNAGLESLRPNIIRDALLVPSLAPDELITLTEAQRLLPPVPGSKETVEEPDYNITILRKVEGQVLERVRIIRIGRMTLRPYEQDIYDHSGRIVTRVLYDHYQKFGEVDYPLLITVTRPIDEYALKIDITKLQVNSKLDDDQFLLKIPDGIPVQKMP